MTEQNHHIHGTTILAVRKNGKVALAGDGQVTMSNTILKHKAKKIRRLYHDKIIAGFSGATADAFTLFEKFENKLNSANQKGVYYYQITHLAIEYNKPYANYKSKSISYFKKLLKNNTNYDALKKVKELEKMG